MYIFMCMYVYVCMYVRMCVLDLCHICQNLNQFGHGKGTVYGGCSELSIVPGKCGPTEDQCSQRGAQERGGGTYTCPCTDCSHHHIAISLQSHSLRPCFLLKLVPPPPLVLTLHLSLTLLHLPSTSLPSPHMAINC